MKAPTEAAQHLHQSLAAQIPASCLLALLFLRKSFSFIK